MLISEYKRRCYLSAARREAGAALLAGALALGMVAADPAMAFDPQKVFKDSKPSPKKLFRFYLKKKKQGEEKEALDVLQYAADQGNPTAQWKLGRMYEMGDSVDRDHRKAFEFYKRIADNYGAARPNTAEWAITGKAMVALGHYYQNGLPEAGIPRNDNEARVMYTTAAMYFRDPDAQFELGKMMLQPGNSLEEGRQAIRMLQLSRKKGHAGAMALLGRALVEGEYVRQDTVQGLSMLTQAARQSNADMRAWIEEMQQQAFAVASEDERRQALLAVKVE